MDNNVIELIREILEKEDSFLLPVKRLWYILRRQPQYRELTLEQLNQMLAEDERCKIYDINASRPETIPPWTKEEEPEMERIGFFLGPRVMLLSRPLTQDALKKSIVRTVDNMQNVLKKAYDMSYANEDMSDYEGEKKLLEIMSQTRDLRKNIEAVLNKAKQEKEDSEKKQ